MRGDFATQRRNLGNHRSLGLGRQIFIGEVDQRLLLRHQRQQPVSPAVVNGAQCAFQLAQRLAALGGGFRRNQVIDRLRLQQVHPAIQERAPGELAGLGGARAPAHQRIGNVINDRLAAMHMQFGRVLAGIGGGGWQEQRDRAIQNTVVLRVAEGPQRGATRLGHMVVGKGNQDGARASAGNANDGDGSATRRCGGGETGVFSPHHT
jgi:hypothetical protein